MNPPSTEKDQSVAPTVHFQHPGPQLLSQGITTTMTLDQVIKVSTIAKLSKFIMRVNVPYDKDFLASKLS